MFFDQLSGIKETALITEFHLTMSMKTRSKTDISLISVSAALFMYYAGSWGLRRYWYALLIRTSLENIPSDLSSLMRMIVRLILVLVIMIYTGQTSIFRRKRSSFFKGLVSGIYIIIFAVGSVICHICLLYAGQPYDNPGIRKVIYYCLYFLLVGVIEELFYRGVISDLILRITLKKENSGRSVAVAVVLSGLIFSLSHAAYLFRSGTSGDLIQMSGALVMGMLFTAVYYRTGNIFSVIFLHVINDIAAGLPLLFSQNTGGISGVIDNYNILNLVSLLPYIGILFFVLRRQNLDKILDTIHERE